MRSMKGKKGYMAIKIDLEKAYDRVNWNFLLGCLYQIGFPWHLVDIIYQCISTPSMQILLNGERTSTFMPSRG